MTESAALWKAYEKLPIERRLSLAQSSDFCKLLVMDQKKFDAEMLELARESGDRHCGFDFFNDYSPKKLPEKFYTKS